MTKKEILAVLRRNIRNNRLPPDDLVLDCKGCPWEKEPDCLIRICPYECPERYLNFWRK
ncbi:MAG: hypothetical protein ACM3WV_09560 [Bacillota bacterium]